MKTVKAFVCTVSSNIVIIEAISLGPDQQKLYRIHRRFNSSHERILLYEGDDHEEMIGQFELIVEPWRFIADKSSGADCKEIENSSK